MNLLLTCIYVCGNNLLIFQLSSHYSLFTRCAHVSLLSVLCLNPGREPIPRQGHCFCGYWSHIANAWIQTKWKLQTQGKWTLYIMLVSSLWSRPSKDYLSALSYDLWFHIFSCQKINNIEVNKYSLGGIGPLRLCASFCCICISQWLL